MQKYQMNEAEQMLVDALRSGRYQQATHQLRRDNKFCCLGVACDILNPDGWSHSDLTDTWFAHDYTNGNEERFALTQDAQEWLGWAEAEGTTLIDGRYGPVSLAGLNDEGFTFDQIADIIEAGLVEHIND